MPPSRPLAEENLMELVNIDARYHSGNKYSTAAVWKTSPYLFGGFFTGTPRPIHRGLFLNPIALV